MVSERNRSDAPSSWGISRRGFIKLAAMAGLLAGCRPTQKATTAPTAVPTAPSLPTHTPFPTPTPTSTPGTVPAPTHTPTPTAAPAPTSTPAATAELITTRVAFVKTGDRSEGVRQAIDLLGINPVEGKTVFLKPNFNSADPAPGSTHPDVLRSLVLKLKEIGAWTITVGDRSGMGFTRRVMEELGVFDLAGELGFDVVVLNELEAVDWAMIAPPDSHWKQGFPFARPCLEAEALVQACCLKTHQYGGHFTMSLKNSVGMVAKIVPGEGYDYMAELHGSLHQRKMIAEINTAYAPALVVMDGVEAFKSGGPATGELVSPEVVLAGTDRIALDAVGVALLRYFGTTDAVARGPVFQQEQIARAVELGLGIDSPHKIEFLTGDADSAAFAEQIEEILVSE